jgi:hypothetical protein
LPPSSSTAELAAGMATIRNNQSTVTSRLFSCRRYACRQYFRRLASSTEAE